MIPICDCLPKGEGYDDPEEKIGDEMDEDTNINDFDEEDFYML